MEATQTAPEKAVQGPSKKASSAGAKVTVACKIPNGLRLRVFQMIKSQELVMGGGVREMQIANPVGEPILINGPAVPFGAIPNFLIVGGYALTEGVDKETWDAWLAANKESQMVKNKLVFAYEKDGMAAGAAHEHEEIRTGLEPMVPDTDPRGRSSLKVTQEEEQKKRLKAA